VTRLLLLGAGALLPGLLLLGVLAAQGVLGRFWFWTVTYAAAYAAEVPWSEAGTWLALGWGTATRATRPFWGLAAAGLVALWIAPRDRRTRVFVTGLVLASGAAVCPGLYFREHYFILLLPAVALLCGVAWETVSELAGRAVSPRAAAGLATLLLLVPAGVFAAAEWEPLVSMTPREFSRARFGPNPFIEAEEIAAYLRDHTDPGDRIAVVGSEPEIYFLSDRVSATGYIYTYALVEPQPYAVRMQDEMRAEIEAAAPAYLVYVQVALSWLPSPGADPGIFEWVQHHTAACYDLVGIAEVRSQEETVYAWDEAVAGHEIRAPNVVFTYRRKRGGGCPDPGSPDAAPIASLLYPHERAAHWAALPRPLRGLGVGPLMEIPAPAAGGFAAQRREPERLRHDQMRPIPHLQRTGDAEEGARLDQHGERLEHRRPDDDVHEAALVLHRHEDDP
jgi:hypothetical protein